MGVVDPLHFAICQANIISFEVHQPISCANKL